ncbi:hypothetical protein KAR91_43930 [Candidatus Pacearchaeota archaeon]|nr:hypothetical protein [Candidatus Pacearchaeota archaeon]
MKRLEAVATRWNKLKNDEERWAYILAHKNEIGIMLDNDATYPVFHESIWPEGLEDYTEDVPDLNGFDEWIGNSPGIDVLMSVLGLQAEGV